MNGITGRMCLRDVGIRENERLLFGTDDGCDDEFYNTKISSSYNDDGKSDHRVLMTPAIAFDTYTK